MRGTVGALLGISNPRVETTDFGWCRVRMMRMLGTAAGTASGETKGVSRDPGAGTGARMARILSPARAFDKAVSLVFVVVDTALDPTAANA
jgi:hypothetical protein